MWEGGNISHTLGTAASQCCGDSSQLLHSVIFPSHHLGLQRDGGGEELPFCVFGCFMVSALFQSFLVLSSLV